MGGGQALYLTMAGVHEMSLPFKKRKAMGLAEADATLAKAVRVCMCVRVCVCACVRSRHAAPPSSLRAPRSREE